MNTTLYFVLNDQEADDSPYYEQYDTLEDAVERSDEFIVPLEIFKADLKSIGFYKTKTSIVKTKKPKARE